MRLISKYVFFKDTASSKFSEQMLKNERAKTALLAGIHSCLKVIASAVQRFVPPAAVPGDDDNAIDDDIGGEFEDEVMDEEYLED